MYRETFRKLKAEFTYYGGHIRFPIEGMMALVKGDAMLDENEIIFRKNAFWKKIEFR